MKFEGDQVPTLNTRHQPASVAPTVVNFKLLQSQHMRQQTLLFSQVMFGALHDVDTQLDTISHPHSREYRIVKLDAQMSSLNLL